MSAVAAPPVPRPASGVDANAVLALIAVAQFMVILDATIVNVALPTIKVDVGFSEQSLSWVLNAYTLMFGGFLLLGGRLADRLGRRRLFVAGIAVFSGASLICGISESEGMLLVARVCKGSAARWSRRRPYRSSSRPSLRGRSATARSPSGARSPARVAPLGCCSAA
jgi:MFS family permease